MREIKHLSVHQWLRSAISDSQQPSSPIGFLFLKLPPPPCAVLLVNFYKHILCRCQKDNVTCVSLCICLFPRTSAWIPLSGTACRSSSIKLSRHWVASLISLCLRWSTLQSHFTCFSQPKVFTHCRLIWHDASGILRTCFGQVICRMPEPMSAWQHHTTTMLFQDVFTEFIGVWERQRCAAALFHGKEKARHEVWEMIEIDGNSMERRESLQQSLHLGGASGEQGRSDTGRYGPR